MYIDGWRERAHPPDHDAPSGPSPPSETHAGPWLEAAQSGVDAQERRTGLARNRLPPRDGAAQSVDSPHPSREPLVEGEGGGGGWGPREGRGRCYSVRSTRTSGVGCSAPRGERGRRMRHGPSRATERSRRRGFPAYRLTASARPGLISRSKSRAPPPAAAAPLLWVFEKVGAGILASTGPRKPALVRPCRSRVPYSRIPDACEALSPLPYLRHWATALQGWLIYTQVATRWVRNNVVHTSFRMA